MTSLVVFGGYLHILALKVAAYYIQGEFLVFEVASLDATHFLPQRVHNLQESMKCLPNCL